MKPTWIFGPRKITDRKGKNHGPVIEQLVIKHWIPKTAA